MLPFSHWVLSSTPINPKPTILSKNCTSLSPPPYVNSNLIHGIQSPSLALSLVRFQFVFQGRSEKEGRTMMMQTMNHFSPAAKTAEIMSRYRPIAPKPEVPMNPSMFENPSLISPKNRPQSPYVRNLWHQLQARPTRTRKRGRTSISPTTLKRTRPTSLLGISSLHGFSQWPPPFPQLPFPNLTPVNTSLEREAAIVTSPESLVTLPLLPPPPPVSVNSWGGERKVIDLNALAVQISEETDHHSVLQLQGSTTASNAVISPQPVRPVGSSIRVGCISEDGPRSSNGILQQLPKKAEEVEEEVESESLPAVVSDSNNKVRLANSAYKEMVGQPECSWLDSMMTSDGRACKRIGGEVMLRFSDSGVPVSSSEGFSCWVNIEWGNSGVHKKSVNVFCDVIKLMCDSKDYLFAWRFHTGTKEVSLSTSEV